MAALRISQREMLDAPSRAARLWLARIKRLQRLLQRDPDHERAWFWRIQMRINAFLISRYGHRTDLAQREENRPRRPLRPRPSIRISTPEQCSMPRSADSLRPSISELHDLGAKRRRTSSLEAREALLARLTAAFDTLFAGDPEPIVIDDPNDVRLAFFGRRWQEIDDATLEAAAHRNSGNSPTGFWRTHCRRSSRTCFEIRGAKWPGPCCANAPAGAGGGCR